MSQLAMPAAMVGFGRGLDRDGVPDANASVSRDPGNLRAERADFVDRCPLPEQVATRRPDRAGVARLRRR